jgi:hypothetical protein
MSKPQTQEVLAPGHYDQDDSEFGAVVVQSSSVVSMINKSEIDQQITTALKYPRQITKCVKELHDLATLSLSVAQSSIYALPRAGKTIEGPSIRFAEMLNYTWRNTRIATQIVAVEDENVRVAGMFMDLERNTATRAEIMRRITNREGKRFDADMIAVTSNAAASIARRNAILHGIPKALWNDCYMDARKVVAGDVKTLVNRVAGMIQSFAIFGIKPEQIYGVLGVNGPEEITTDHIVLMGGIHTAIKEKTVTPEEAFAPDKMKTPGSNGGGARAPERSDFKEQPKQTTAKGGGKKKDEPKKADDPKKADEPKQTDNTSQGKPADAQSETQSTKSPETASQVNQNTANGNAPAGASGTQQTATQGKPTTPEKVYFPAPPKVDADWWKDQLDRVYALSMSRSVTDVRLDLEKELAGNDEAVRLIGEACAIQMEILKGKEATAKK